MNKITNLYFSFMLSQLLFLIAPFFEISLINDRYLNLQSAIIVHLIAMIVFTLGYLFPIITSKLKSKYSIDRKINKPIEYVFEFNKLFFFVSYLLVFFGLFITIYQVAIFQNPIQYVLNLFSGNFISSIRKDFLTSADEGGISGFFKMFGFSPLCIYLSTLSLLQFINISAINKKKMRILNFTALIFTILRTIFSLDRISIVAIMLANIFIFIRFHITIFFKRIIKSFARVFWTVIAIIFISFVSSSRLEGYNILDFIFLYYKSGIVNLQLIIDTTDGYTYGFSSILKPLIFILKFFNVPISIPSPSFDWQLFSAQYLVGYAYLDFGYFYMFIFLYLGNLCRKIDIKALSKNNIYYVSIYFIVLYCIISFAGVPMSNGIDFWFTLIVPIVLLKLFVKQKIRENEKLKV